MTFNGWTIRKAKSLGGIFGRSMKVFFSTLRWKSVCLPRTSFLIMVRGDIFSLNDFFLRLPPPNLLSFFSNGDIPKLKQLL